MPPQEGSSGHHPVTLRGAIDADRSQESTTGRTPTGRKPETPERRPQTPVTPYEVSRLSRHVSEIVWLARSHSLESEFLKGACAPL